MKAGIMEGSDEPSSLFDFINAHKSTGNNEDEEITSLSDLTTKHLKLHETDNSLSNYLLSSFGSCSKEICDKEPFQLSILEENLKSFLANKNSNITTITYPNKNESSMYRINKGISNINISDDRTEFRNIDLTTTLLEKCDASSNISSVMDEVCNQFFKFPLKECIIDIKSLADEEVLYCNSKMSYFGYVISRQWKKFPSPKKCRKFQHEHPYKLSKTFKFDSPSPDDLILQSRHRKLTE